MTSQITFSVDQATLTIVPYDHTIKHKVIQRLFNRKSRQLRALINIHMTHEPDTGIDLRNTILDEITAINRQIRLMLAIHTAADLGIPRQRLPTSRSTSTPSITVPETSTAPPATTPTRPCRSQPKRLKTLDIL